MTISKIYYILYVEMSFPYTVVQFPQEETYSEIPTSWLTKDYTQCRWPKTKNATYFIKKLSTRGGLIIFLCQSGMLCGKYA